MDKKIYLNDLYDFYKDLFTGKQQQYFEEYYFEDLSLGEIAENNNVSRNAVHGQVKIVEERLIEYEEILKLYEKSNKIRDLIKDIDPKTKEQIEELL